jgi:hypothetical protein
MISHPSKSFDTMQLRAMWTVLYVSCAVAADGYARKNATINTDEHGNLMLTAGGRVAITSGGETTFVDALVSSTSPPTPPPPPPQLSHGNPTFAIARRLRTCKTYGRTHTCTMPRIQNG